MSVTIRVVLMANIVEELNWLDWQIQNLFRSFFSGKVNKGRDRKIKDLLKQRSDIYRAIYPSKHKE